MRNFVRQSDFRDDDFARTLRLDSLIGVDASGFQRDHLCFSGEILLARKHTGQIHDDLPVMADRALDGLRSIWYHHGLRVGLYREKRLTGTRSMTWLCVPWTMVPWLTVT